MPDLREFAAKKLGILPREVGNLVSIEIANAFTQQCVSEAVGEREAWKEHTSLIHNSFTVGAPLIGKGTPYEIFFLAFAMSGECGEVANLLKKSWRGDFPLDAIKDHLRLELADVRIYLEHLARESGIDLDEACNDKVAELKKRWPDRLESGKR